MLSQSPHYFQSAASSPMPSSIKAGVLPKFQRTANSSKQSNSALAPWLSIAALFVALVFALLANISLAYTFPSEAQLRLNPNMHTATIKRVDVDKAQRYAVTASDDKSVLLWELASGKVLRRLRLPADKGNVGKAFAVAISPNGERIAVGGYTGNSESGAQIYIFQRSSGALVHTIEGLGNVILHLTYSPKGKYLAASLAGGEGLRIYRNQIKAKTPSKSYQEVFADSDYDGEDSYWLSWHGEKQVLSSADDGNIRLYQLKGRRWRLLNSQQTEGKPFALALHPKKAQVVVGFVDSTKLLQLSLPKLQTIATPNTGQFDNGDLSKVAWSHSGQQLCAGGTYLEKGFSPILCWQKGQSNPQSISLTTQTLMDVRPLQDGGFIAASGDGLSRIDKNGKLRWQHLQPLADFRGQVGSNSIRVSQDGSQVAFGFKLWGKQAAGWNMAKMRLLSPPPADWQQDLSPALSETPPIKVTDWKDKYQPKLNGEAIKHLDHYETSRSLAIKPPGTAGAASFVLGTEWQLRHIDQQGQQLWHKAMPGIVWALNISGDGRWVVAGLGDGTLRWYELASGEEKLALFAHNNQQDWVLWTPEGFFASSGPEANKLVGFQLNNGAQQAPDFVAASQLYNSFYRPDMVLAKFQGEDEKVQQALADIGDVREVLKQRPPLLALSKPLPTSIAGTRLTVPLKITDQGGGIGEIEVYVNGIRQAASRAGSRYHPSSAGTKTLTLNVPPNTTSDIKVIAMDAKGKLGSNALNFPVKSTAKLNSHKPRLIGLAIGVENYKDGDLQLNYALNDINGFKKAMEQQGSQLYREVNIELLHDATLEQIENSLQAYQGKNTRVNEDDVFVLFLSGHGLTNKGEYHFLPQDFILRSHKSFKDTLSSNKLNNFLAKLPARKALVFFDTCYAGSFQLKQENDKTAKTSFKKWFASRSGAEDKLAISQLMEMEQETAIDRLNQLSGRAIFYASSDKTVALEGYKGNGLYTSLLLRALKGEASQRPLINLHELAGYLDVTMPKVSREAFGVALYPMADFTTNFDFYAKAKP